jgi:L-glyceraldehyde 3-phosphate reductase
MGLDYVDVFYSHRPDPDTPLEETMGALDHAVRSGRALYAGISSYPPAETRAAAAILRALGTPCVIHQPRYSMFDRTIEGGVLDAIAETGMGCIVFSPLAQGLLTDRYLRDIPADSRAAKAHGALDAGEVSAERRRQIARLDEIARGRGQKLAQLAVAWVLRHPAVTSALIGASRVAQVEDGVGALRNLAFADDELRAIDAVLADGAPSGAG